jgi:hypothetical protein
MQERSRKFEEEADESEVTLAAPRFDADDARHAHPVVPLEEAPARPYPATGRARFRGGARRQLPLTLIVVALLAAAALGAVAAQVLRRAHTAAPAPVSAEAAQDGQPTQTDTTQPQSAPAPAESGEGKAEGRAPIRAREERAVHTRHDEDVPTPPEAAGAERVEVDRGDGEHRGHLKGRDEDRDEKEAKKDSKHSKKGGARLVDVIVGPPRP